MNDLKEKYENLMQKSNDFFDWGTVEEVDGELVCKVCGKAKTKTIPLPANLFVEPLQAHLSCDCHLKFLKAEEAKRAEEERRQAAVMRGVEVAKLKTLSGLGSTFQNCDFLKIDKDVDKSILTAMERCQKYCEVAGLCLAKGLGFIIIGSSGVGKTMLMACMINKLIEDKLFTCRFIELGETVSQIIQNRGQFKNGENIYGVIEETDFLFIDDVGSERVKTAYGDSASQEKIYSLINERYKIGKPTIFTSNYDFEELVKIVGLQVKTVDRIREMATDTMKVSGDSYRRRIRLKNKSEIPF